MVKSRNEEPSKRTELLEKGITLFNGTHFFEAHEEWENLWHLEHGGDRVFIQGLIQVAGHLVLVQKRQWSGALALLRLAREKLRSPIAPVRPQYAALNLATLLGALECNEALLLEVEAGAPPPAASLFILPQLMVNRELSRV